MYLLRTNADYVTSRKEMRASIFKASWARELRNSILTTKFFVRYRLLASTKDLIEPS